MEACLGSEHVAPRLQAAAFIGDFPSQVLRPALVRSLADPLFTVRWRAVGLLATLGSELDLIAVLARSTPRAAEARQYGAYSQALEALGVTHQQVLERREHEAITPPREA